MALTKVSGGILQQPIDVGIITATSIQVGSGTTIHDAGIDLGSGNITSHNINSTGIVTSTGLDVNGNGDISGDLSVSGNVSIGGTLTYEDVTNIDSVGIVTARQGIDTDTVRGKTNNSNLAIGARASNGAFVQTITIKPDRSVGLGNITNPTSILDVRQTNTGAATEIKLFNLDQSNATTQTAALVMTPDVRANGVKIVAVKEVADMSSSANKDLALTFQTVANNAAAEKLRITSTGQLLLGINNAVDAEVDLQIHSATSGNGPILNMTNDTGDCRIFFGQDNSSGSANAQGQIRYNVANNYLAVYAAGGERLRINSSGNIGIGTNNPARRLSINNGSADEDIIRMYNDEVGINFGAWGTGSAYPREATINGTRFDSGSSPFLRIGGQGGIKFCADLNNERMRIKSDGKVGIGTDNVDYKLEVFGAPGADGDFSIKSSASASSGTEHSKLRFRVRNASNQESTKASIHVESAANWGGNLIFGTKTSSGGLSESTVERLRITSGGDVCVGGHSSNYANSPLEVRGTNAGGDVAIRVTNNSTDSGTQAGIIFTTTTADYTTAGIGYERGTDDALKFYVGQSAGGGGFTNAYEKLRINDKAELIQKSATNSTNSWYSLNSNNTVTVTNGDNDIYIERVGGSNGYDQLVYKKTPMTDNCDISFRLSGSQPGGQWRHIGITICGDGGSDFSNMDRLVIRQQGSTGGSNNRIRVDKAGGGTTADVTSGSIPSFFDGTERNVLIQIRGNIIHVLSDNVLVFSEQMDAALHDVSGFFGIGIYETSGNIRLRNFQLTNYGALGVPQKRPCLQTNMSSTYGSHGSLTTNTASTGILQASAYVDLCGNYTTSGSNAYTFVCPVDGVYAVNAHISMGGGNYSRHIWVMSYTLGGGNLPLGTYTEVLDLHPDTHSNHSYYNLWKFTKGTRVGMGINGNSGSLSGRNFQWGIMLVS